MIRFSARALVTGLVCMAGVACPEGIYNAQAGDTRHERSVAPRIEWRELQPGLALAGITLDAASMVGAAPPDAPVASGASGAPGAPVAGSAGGLNSPSAAIPAPAPVLSMRAADPVVMVARIDPTRFEFMLHMASADMPRSLPDAAQHYGLVAAINASMYLPDGQTSTGHLRSGGHVNNPRIVEKFGAFFVANPCVAGRAPAALLDRTQHDWRNALEDYDLVVQNYRLSSHHGSVLWRDNGPPHSVAALSQDSAGNILFIFCREPVPPGALARALLRLPLQLQTIMYLEGGPQAAMLVRAGPVDTVWVGRHVSGIWGTGGSADAPLPNIIGVRPRK